MSSLRLGFISKTALTMIALFCLALFSYHQYITPPRNFPEGYQLSIERGQSLFSVSQELFQDGAIKSPRVFEMMMIILGSDRGVSEGVYLFEVPTSVFEVALRITGSQFGATRQKITFPEGFSNQEMIDRLKRNFPEFDTEGFATLIEEKQGYLFPDTYAFFRSVQPVVVVTALEENFERKITPFKEEIKQSGRSLEEIIIMASIIEKEANGPQDRAMISGILWQRIERGMPLQVDAPFLYILGKTSAQLTRADLAIKSPFNTYVNKGLPPTPINNPGVAAITAALRPVASEYVYYLHDENGGVHYASTYAMHLQNIKKYLR